MVHLHTNLNPPLRAVQRKAFALALSDRKASTKRPREYHIRKGASPASGNPKNARPHRARSGCARLGSHSRHHHRVSHFPFEFPLAHVRNNTNAILAPDPDLSLKPAGRNSRPRQTRIWRDGSGSFTHCQRSCMSISWLICTRTRLRRSALGWRRVTFIGRCSMR